MFIFFKKKLTSQFYSTRMGCTYPISYLVKFLSRRKKKEKKEGRESFCLITLSRKILGMIKVECAGFNKLQGTFVFLVSSSSSFLGPPFYPFPPYYPVYNDHMLHLHIDFPNFLHYSRTYKRTFKKSLKVENSPQCTTVQVYRYVCSYVSDVYHLITDVQCVLVILLILPTV